MRAVVERVANASVVAGTSTCGSISKGLLVYVGVERDDGEADVLYIADKIRQLRIFSDDAGQLNLNVVQARGSVLVVSAFTLLGDARRGRRPSFESAAPPDRAIVIYELLCDALHREGLNVERGIFGDDMSVQAINDGPVCILLESRRAF